jgi:hypothetical protein
VSQADENAGMHRSIHPTRNSQDKGTRHQMDMIDLEDELKDAKILTL